MELPITLIRGKSAARMILVTPAGFMLFLRAMETFVTGIQFSLFSEN